MHLKTDPEFTSSFLLLLLLLKALRVVVAADFVAAAAALTQAARTHLVVVHVQHVRPTLLGRWRSAPSIW